MRVTTDPSFQRLVTKSSSITMLEEEVKERKLSAPKKFVLNESF